MEPPLLLLVQFMVLVFTLLVWWLARRDLSSKAAESHSPAVADWQRLRGTVEELIADLEIRAAAAEQRITEAEMRLSSADIHAASVPLAFETASLAPAGFIDTQQAAHENLYSPVYALLDQGLTDAAEIAKRTGLSRGEIELILGLRARRASL